MPLRNAIPITFQPKGLTDAVDATNAFEGAMSLLSNLIPSQDTDRMWIPRPGAVSKFTFGSLTTPGFQSAMLVVGDIMYGLIASGRNAGKDEPFVLNLATNTLIPVSGILSTNVPTSPATTGAWTPPIMAVVGTRIVVCHPGFAGGATKFGWFDISSFNSTGITGTTHSSTLIDALSSNVLNAGWQPGMTIVGTGIPAGATIVSIAAGGLSVTISVAATSSGAGVGLTVAGGTPSAPLWGAGDTNLHNLPSVPVSVAQMNGRAFFAVSNGVVLSDPLNACSVTNASQALTFNNGLGVTALGALGLSSPITGGIVQAIIAFQSVSAMQVITGDPLNSPANLSVNTTNVATGTLAPLSVVPTSLGLAFVSPDGLRFVDWQVRVTDPVGDHGSGITAPFINALYPSRLVLGANSDTIRITTQNALASVPPNLEYWFDITRKVWSGPHSFPASLIQPWRASFVMSATGINAAVWQSDVQGALASTYVENGVQLSSSYQTTLLPDNQQNQMNQVVESTIGLALPGGTNALVTALDETGTPIDQVLINQSSGLTLWDSFVWGQALWQGAVNAYRQYRVNWHYPIVFKQMSIQVSFLSLFGLRVGNLYAKHQTAGYMLETVT